MNPRTMTLDVRARCLKDVGDLLIVLSHTARASATVFAPHRYPRHAVNAEGLFVELPEANQLLNNCLLGGTTVELWYVSRIFNHANRVKVGTE